MPSKLTRGQRVGQGLAGGVRGQEWGVVCFASQAGDLAPPPETALTLRLEGRAVLVVLLGQCDARDEGAVRALHFELRLRAHLEAVLRGVLRVRPQRAAEAAVH